MGEFNTAIASQQAYCIEWLGSVVGLHTDVVECRTATSLVTGGSNARIVVFESYNTLGGCERYIAINGHLPWAMLEAALACSQCSGT